MKHETNIPTSVNSKILRVDLLDAGLCKEEVVFKCFNAFQNHIYIIGNGKKKYTIIGIISWLSITHVCNWLSLEQGVKLCNVSELAEMMSSLPSIFKKN